MLQITLFCVVVFAILASMSKNPTMTMLKRLHLLCLEEPFSFMHCRDATESYTDHAHMETATEDK